MTRIEAIQRIASFHFETDTLDLGTAPLRTSAPIAYLRRPLSLTPVHEDLLDLAPEFSADESTDLRAIAVDVAVFYRAMLDRRMILINTMSR